MRRLLQSIRPAGGAGGTRGIRTTIPPRPAVTTVVFLTTHGYNAKNKETDLSLIRTRDNKFWLQRMLPSGEVIRWRVPGLDFIKQSTSFEAYNLSDINFNGGVLIPRDLAPTPQAEPHTLQDAAYVMSRIAADKKVTRKDRRSWHRRLHAHWRESPEKYFNHSIGYYGIPFAVLLWVVVRYFHSVRNDKPFWDNNVYSPDDHLPTHELWLRAKLFSDHHPEHAVHDPGVTQLSPAQSRMSTARVELRETDSTDPHFHGELWWKLRHLRYYGHWPKSLTAD